MAGSTTTRAWARARAVHALALGLALAAGEHVAAQPAPEAQPVNVQPANAKPVEAAAPAGANDGAHEPPEARVRRVLEAHCAACRVARAGEDAPLSLEALAADPSLVAPGRPDASRIYQQLLVRKTPAKRTASESAAQPADAAPEAAPEPPRTDATDIEAVRDWIEALPAREQGCHGRAPVTGAAIEAQIDRWVAAVGVAEAKDTRFVSMAHLWNACASPAELMQQRDATAALLGALARQREPLEIETLGDESALLALRASELRFLAGEWERLTAPAPPTPSAEAVPADWLAMHVLAKPKDAAGNADPAFDVRFDGAAQRAVGEQARGWTRDVDLVRAAGERGTTPRALMLRLAALEGDLVEPAQRLIHGALSRAAWDRFSRALDGEPVQDLSGMRPPVQASDVQASDIDVLLWTDKPVYRPRDLATFNVRVSRACHLTIVNVDQDGDAIVLFPNDLEPDNLVAPSVTVRVPGHHAGYQLRFDESGEEEFVAICERASRRPEGIDFDYEKQRFRSLGNWRAFLRSAPEREREIAAQGSGENGRRRRRGRPPAPVGPPAIGAGEPVTAEGRAAIYVTIEPAGAATR